MHKRFPDFFLIEYYFGIKCNIATSPKNSPHENKLHERFAIMLRSGIQARQYGHALVREITFFNLLHVRLKSYEHVATHAQYIVFLYIALAVHTSLKENCNDKYNYPEAWAKTTKNGLDAALDCCLKYVAPSSSPVEDAARIVETILTNYFERVATIYTDLNKSLSKRKKENIQCNYAQCINAWMSNPKTRGTFAQPPSSPSSSGVLPTHNK